MLDIGAESQIVANAKLFVLYRGYKRSCIRISILNYIYFSSRSMAELETVSNSYSLSFIFCFSLSNNKLEYYSDNLAPE